jgi:hypothetical protein
MMDFEDFNDPTGFDRLNFGWLLQDLGWHISQSFVILLSIFILWTLSYIYVAFGNRPWIAAIFYGLKRAVLRECRGNDVEVAFRPSQDLLAPGSPP